MLTIDSIPSWYIALSLVIAFYQGGRGFIFQYHQSKNYELSKNWAGPARIFMYCIADFIFYFVTTIIGFAFTFTSIYVIFHVPGIQEVGAGFSAIMIFLLLIGVLGMCGQLPYLIQSGKLPWQK